MLGKESQPKGSHYILELTTMIMESFIGFGGLNEIKLVCFGVDGITIFQGVKIGGHHTTNVEMCSIFEWCALHGTLHKTWLFKP